MRKMRSSSSTLLGIHHEDFIDCSILSSLSLSLSHRDLPYFSSREFTDDASDYSGTRPDADSFPHPSRRRKAWRWLRKIAIWRRKDSCVAVCCHGDRQRDASHASHWFMHKLLWPIVYLTDQTSEMRIKYVIHYWDWFPGLSRVDIPFPTFRERFNSLHQGRLAWHWQLRDTVSGRSSLMKWTEILYETLESSKIRTLSLETRFSTCVRHESLEYHVIWYTMEYTHTINKYLRGVIRRNFLVQFDSLRSITRSSLIVK